MIAPPSAEALDAKQKALLDAAVGVFARFGFRKTSMDEVAKAAGISRQGLYLQFSNKEELFRRALEYSLRQQYTAAAEALARTDTPLEQRLAAACDAWSGRFIGISGADAADLMCASTSLGGTTLADYETQFDFALADCIANSPLMRVCAVAEVTPEAAAQALHAMARGLKHRAKTRAEFQTAMTAAARMFCISLKNQEDLKGHET
jgi:TetR/AcrR family transcriptional regulator of autoinduction and epiphytic fitness